MSCRVETAFLLACAVDDGRCNTAILTGQHLIMQITCLHLDKAKKSTADALYVSCICCCLFVLGWWCCQLTQTRRCSPSKTSWAGTAQDSSWRSSTWQCTERCDAMWCRPCLTAYIRFVVKHRLGITTGTLCQIQEFSSVQQGHVTQGVTTRISSSRAHLLSQLR